jgi:hypothetical protein
MLGSTKNLATPEDRAMPSIHPNDVIANLPTEELQLSLRAFLQPVTSLLPDVRLRAVAELIAQGIVTSQSPVVTQIARATRYTDETVWPTCKRAYRFLGNSHFTHRTLLKGLYHVAQRAVVEQKPPYLVVAVDPVNFEKPYTQTLEGVSRVMKDTPPCLGHPQRITRGYPAITATIVTLTQPATTYANWFSYETPEFIRQNREVEKAFRVTRTLFSGQKLRFVGDAGLDDQKVFAQVARVQGEFVIRGCHDRDVDVYNPQRKRWEHEKLFDLVATIPFAFEQKVAFTHAGKTWRVRTGFGWLPIRLPDTQQVLWLLVAHSFDDGHDLLLLTNVPLRTASQVRQVYQDWRLRGKIEQGYRFEQEQGLDVEDLRVETLERMRRLFVLVLLAAQFICYIGRTWAQPAVQWLRLLGGKLGLKSDRNGLYVLMRGISAVWQTAATLTFSASHPFPR